MPGEFRGQRSHLGIQSLAEVSQPPHPSHLHVVSPRLWERPSALTGRFPLCLMDRSARLGPCSVRGGGGGRVVALSTPPAMRDGGGGGGGGRKPQDWAWQMGQQKPAWALLIKQNEAWDHKIFCLIPGSHGGGADQLGRQRRKVYRGKPGAGWAHPRPSLSEHPGGSIFRICPEAEPCSPLPCLLPGPDPIISCRITTAASQQASVLLPLSLDLTMAVGRSLENILIELAFPCSEAAEACLP